MADFVQKAVNKTAVRDLAVPITTVTSFNNLIETIIDDNPFGCVGYTGSDGVPVAAIIRNREHYTAKVNFLDGEAVRNGPGPCSITAGLPQNSCTGREDQTAGEGAGSDSTCTDRETHLSLSTKVQQNRHTAPNTGSRVSACAGVCEIQNVGIDLMTSPPGDGNTNQTSFNRHLSDITCYNLLKTGAKREPVLQEPLPGVLDHRTFSRTKIEHGWCGVCGTGKAVYRSREAQTKVYEAATPGWSGSGTGRRGCGEGPQANPESSICQTEHPGDRGCSSSCRITLLHNPARELCIGKTK